MLLNLDKESGEIISLSYCLIDKKVENIKSASKFAYWLFWTWIMLVKGWEIHSSPSMGLHMHAWAQIPLISPLNIFWNFLARALVTELMRTWIEFTFHAFVLALCLGNYKLHKLMRKNEPTNGVWIQSKYHWGQQHEQKLEDSNKCSMD